jgi:hypothetical protein
MTRGAAMKWVVSWSGSVGFEADGVEVVAGGEADVGVEGGRQAAQQRNGGLGAAFFDALDLVGGHIGAQAEVGDAEAKRDAPVIDRLPEGQGLGGGDTLQVPRLGFGEHPAGVGAGHHACFP